MPRSIKGSMTKRNLLIFFSMMLAATAVGAQDVSILNPSGLPIPRYVSLKSTEVNLRVGPGQRYPIAWVYQRAGLPVKIIEEFAHWRKIQDFEGTTGWVNKGLLESTRTALIMGQSQLLYEKPDATSPAVIRAEPMVIGQVLGCAPDWCLLVIEGREGWIRKPDIWGVGREEVFEE
ncbi:MAG: SH3 domain-containing protein [Alphaproteobacteria bacterium]